MRQGKTVSTRVEYEEYYEAMRAKSPNIRSHQGQISYWSKLGRVGLAHPDLTIREVEKLVIEAALRKQEQEQEGYSE